MEELRNRAEGKKEHFDPIIVQVTKVFLHIVNYLNHLCSTLNVVWELRCKQIKAPIREQKIIGGKHALVRALTQKL